MKLGVNIDHVATLRQVRYRSRRKVSPWAEPCLLDAVRAVEQAGAHGITIHLREDRRHIQDQDVWTARRLARLPLNLEMAASPEILRIALKVRPAEVCIVPERREEVTTEGGLDVVRAGTRLRRTVSALQEKGIVVSLFIAPDPAQIRAAAATGAEFIELHTGAFAEARNAAQQAKERTRLKRAAELAVALGLRVNAGHGIRYTNVGSILKVPHLETLNIGHSIVSRAVMVGLQQAVREMLQRMQSR
ncbi:MAG: pyridoxine 5'-phosphate synthase [Verrucomicrobia bacterium]|nr:pyridoxine 5'-phosphate synthase [Verrucomicrobiota bacterium]